jgi:hypothetical protein
MIYWVTNSGTSSARIYYESRHMLGGLAHFPAFEQPKLWIDDIRAFFAALPPR